MRRDVRVIAFETQVVMFRVAVELTVNSVGICLTMVPQLARVTDAVCFRREPLIM